MSSMRMSSAIRCRGGPCSFPARQRRSVAVRSSADDKFADYKCTTAFFFPGQGAQSVGMAQELVETCPAAKTMFDNASEILGYDLLEVCVKGPADRLNSTAVSQPAIYVSSLAAVEKLRMDPTGPAIIDSVDVAAGLSLGEYTALAFAGVMSFEDGLKLVQLRGASMQAAADLEASSMVSVIGLDVPKTEALCAAAAERSGKPIQIANYLCNGNLAVSGAAEACDVLQEIAKPEFKARMTVRLAVAGAFHTDFMQPAVEKLQAALEATAFSPPRIPVVSNVDAQPHSDPEEIKKLLARQVVAPVQWEPTCAALQERGLSQSYELGPGKVISGLWKRIDKTHSITNISA